MKSTHATLALLVLLAISSPAAAQSSSDWQNWATGDRFRIAVGYFAPDLDTAIVVTDVGGNIGTGISFERNLGLDDNQEPGC